jgi:hypothetical protein
MSPKVKKKSNLCFKSPTLRGSANDSTSCQVVLNARDPLNLTVCPRSIVKVHCCDRLKSSLSQEIRPRVMINKSSRLPSKERDFSCCLALSPRFAFRSRWNSQSPSRRHEKISLFTRYVHLIIIVMEIRPEFISLRSRYWLVLCWVSCSSSSVAAFSRTFAHLLKCNLHCA